jgi:hypothetical protein
MVTDMLKLISSNDNPRPSFRRFMTVKNGVYRIVTATEKNIVFPLISMKLKDYYEDGHSLIDTQTEYGMALIVVLPVIRHGKTIPIHGAAISLTEGAGDLILPPLRLGSPLIS